MSPPIRVLFPLAVQPWGASTVEYKDYYKELGVEKTATEAEIKKAYRKLVRKYHPDVSKEPDADKRTKALNEAYGVLGDAEKRAAYDELGRNQGAQGQPFRPPPDWGSGYESSGADDSDFFADLFAHVGGRRRAGGSFQMQGEDSHAAITIDLHDSYHGAKRHIVMRVPEADAQGHVVTRERTPATCIWKFASSPMRATRWKGATCSRRCPSRHGKRRWAARSPCPRHRARWPSACRPIRRRGASCA